MCLSISPSPTLKYSGSSVQPCLKKTSRHLPAGAYPSSTRPAWNKAGQAVKGNDCIPRIISTDYKRTESVHTKNGVMEHGAAIYFMQTSGNVSARTVGGPPRCWWCRSRKSLRLCPLIVAPMTSRHKKQLPLIFTCPECDNLAPLYPSHEQLTTIDVSRLFGLCRPCS